MDANPRRVAAGRKNRLLRGPLTAAGRERLRQAAHAVKPWLKSTGPQTAAGRRQAAQNGKVRQIGALSIREARAFAAVARELGRLAREACAAAER